MILKGTFHDDDDAETKKKKLLRSNFSDMNLRIIMLWKCERSKKREIEFFFTHTKIVIIIQKWVFLFLIFFFLYLHSFVHVGDCEPAEKSSHKKKGLFAPMLNYMQIATNYFSLLCICFLSNNVKSCCVQHTSYIMLR